MSTQDLQNALYKALTPVERGRPKYGLWWPQGLFCTEISAPGGRRRGQPRPRRADVIWVGKNKAGIHGYELKASRRDLQRELVDPAKAGAWKQYCNTWTLVVGADVNLGGLAVPEDWGILMPRASGREMFVVKSAPPLEPVDQIPAYRQLMMWQVWKHAELSAKATSQERELHEFRVGEVA